MKKILKALFITGVLSTGLIAERQTIKSYSSVDTNKMDIIATHLYVQKTPRIEATTRKKTDFVDAYLEFNKSQHQMIEEKARKYGYMGISRFKIESHTDDKYYYFIATGEFYRPISWKKTKKGNK